MRIQGNGFSIHVYSNDHPPPHCHVRYNDGTETVIDIPLVDARFGATISREVRELVVENLDKMCDEWERLNPPKKEKTKTTKRKTAKRKK